MVAILLVTTAQANKDDNSGARQYADILTHRGVPESATDWSFAPFSDQGAWFGFAVPGEHRPDLWGGFSGPFLMSNGQWLAQQLVKITLSDVNTGQRIQLSTATQHRYVSLPGMLTEKMEVDGLSISQSLWFDRVSESRSGLAMLRASIKNTTTDDKKITIGWTGNVFQDQQTLKSTDQRLLVTGSSGDVIRMSFTSKYAEPVINGSSYQVSGGQSLLIKAGQTITTALVIDLVINGDSQLPGASLDSMLSNMNQSYRLNRDRWSGWLTSVLQLNGMDSDGVIAVKSLQTLINNWRGPAGRLNHHGMFPSHNVWYFNGYWAWDTWKQAVGVLSFDPELAKALVWGMFEHQDNSGMIADVVYLDSSEDNWRDSKPPLAGWAIDAIYQVTGDVDFVRALYSRLVAYHEFWYRDRDHNKNGLCEYGSTDGTLEAARWESGMDNAVRFDKSEMVQNHATAWSMNQESVDLNSYLYLEKLALANLAKALGKEHRHWLEGAEKLAGRIRKDFYEEESGWFYDININDGSFVRTQSPEGWIPLWAGIATQQQAKRVRNIIMDNTRFRTHVPFPTVVANDAEFSDGYWRGLVWLDQVYFGIEGLRRYGYEDDAAALTRQLFSNLQGVAEPGIPIYENYHPLTGEGQNVRHFSWSAAHLLMLTRNKR
jgi:putative isomerase